MSCFLELGTQKLTPLCLLEIIKRILVDHNKNYGKLILMTSYFNKLIEDKVLVEHLKEDNEYKENMIKSILCLLPYAADYFQETNQINCFDHLFKSLLELVITQDDEIIKIFNQYIDSLLNTENHYRNYIAMRFASVFLLLEQVNEKFVENIKLLLEHLPECDLSNELERDIYTLLFSNFEKFFSKALQQQEIGADYFFQYIFAYFDKFHQ